MTRTYTKGSTHDNTAAAGRLIRLAIAALFLTLAVHLLRDRVDALSIDAVLAHIGAIAMPMVLLGLALTFVSYVAIAGYDVLTFGLIGKRLPLPVLLRTGAAATGIGQALGFGVVVGGGVRWRMLRHLGVGPKDAAAASALVASGFFCGLAVVMATMTQLASDTVAGLTGLPRSSVVALSVLVLTIFALVASTRRIEIGLFGRRFSLPGRTLMLRQAVLAALDVIPAGLVLWVFLPAEVDAGIGTVLIAYAAALAAGLLANTPGGIGAFEAVFLIALPDAPVASVMAGILCFRMIYYGLPFGIGLALLTRAEWRSGRAAGRPAGAIPAVVPAGAPDADARISRAVATSDRAEAHLAFLGDKQFATWAEAPGFVMFGTSGRTPVAMGDPVGPRGDWPLLIDRFRDQARRHGSRYPAFYKIGPEAAAICRARGLRTDRIGHEAVLDLATFDLAGPTRRELRRKTRQATKSGVEIHKHAPGTAPMGALAAVACAWRDAKQGRERSFSTGHFDPDYVARFPVFEARRDGRCCAFVTVWISGDGSEWALDLMRNRVDAPAGTMHALVVAAATEAKASGAARFNLCMAPLSGLEDGSTRAERLGAAVYRHGNRLHGLQGLYRFKSSFRPDWQPRYLARQPGPAAIGAALAAYRLCRRVPEPQAAAVPVPRPVIVQPLPAQTSP